MGKKAWGNSVVCISSCITYKFHQDSVAASIEKSNDSNSGAKKKENVQQKTNFVLTGNLHKMFLFVILFA